MSSCNHHLQKRQRTNAHTMYKALGTHAQDDHSIHDRYRVVQYDIIRPFCASAFRHTCTCRMVSSSIRLSLAYCNCNWLRMARVLCVIVRLVLAMLVIAMTEIFFSTTIDHKHNPQHDVSECVTTYLEVNVRTDVCGQLFRWTAGRARGVRVLSESASRRHNIMIIGITWQ